MPTSRIVSTAMASISVGRDFMVLSSAPEMRLAWISTPGRSSRVGVARLSTSPRAEVPTMTMRSFSSSAPSAPRITSVAET